MRETETGEICYITTHQITKIRDSRQYIAVETAICHNRPVHYFTGHEKNLTDP
jgi:hypothetical protein